MTEQEELEKLLQINEEDLEGEWLDQPKRYVTCARIAARYEMHASLAKAEYEKAWSQSFLNLKVHAKDGIKLTDPAAKAAVELDKTVIEKQKELTEAEERVFIMRAIVRAFEMRERSLKYVQMLRAIPAESQDRELARAVARRSMGLDD